MRIPASFLFAVLFSVSAAAQTTEPAAGRAAEAAFSAVERQLIADFFASTGLTARELEVIGEAAAIVTGEEAVREAVARAVGADDEAGTGNKNKGKGKGKDGDLPPGLAKKDELPPGLAMQLERNGTLPPGLAMRKLPDALDAKLPVPKAGHERVVVGSDVVLVERATRRILDILKDVIPTQ